MAATRRQFLLGATGLSVLAASAVMAVPATRAIVSADCAQIHAKLIANYEALTRSASFTATNVASMAMNMACPCCGQPLFSFLS